MQNQKKQTTAGGGLYIALAICVLSVICIGVYSAVLNIFQSPIPSDPLGQNTEENKAPSFIIETPSPTEDDFDVNLPGSVPDPDPTPIPPVPDQNANSQPSAPTYSLPLAGGVSKPFSYDALVYSETMNDYRVHNGVDLIATVGTPVKAFSDGTVKEIYEDPLMGQTVVLEHDNETVSIYQNLSTALPEGILVGSRVLEGQVIGGVGETVLVECAEEPHLHFEVLVNGKHVDPMSYFS